MGEIRSTLDIIMERTKNLSLSPEEKQKIRRREWLGKARGWVQRYLDGVVDLEALQREFGSLGDSAGGNDDLRREIMGAVDPGEDQQRRWEVLETLWQTPRTALAESLEACRASLSRAEREWAEKGLKRLAEQGVGGTAVVPNLDQDPEWASFRTAMVRDCLEKLQQIK